MSSRSRIENMTRAFCKQFSRQMQALQTLVGAAGKKGSKDEQY
jgi:hypothetical protein